MLCVLHVLNIKIMHAAQSLIHLHCGVCQCCCAPFVFVWGQHMVTHVIGRGGVAVPASSTTTSGKAGVIAASVIIGSVGLMLILLSSSICIARRRRASCRVAEAVCHRLAPM